MWHLGRLGIVSVLSLLAAACAATTGYYPSLPQNQPGANIRMSQREDASVVYATENQTFSFNHSESCDTGVIVAAMNWTTSKASEVRIPLRPIRINGITQVFSPVYPSSQTMALQEQSCSSAVLLTPADGHTYLVTQDSSAECLLQVVDADPQASPPNVVRLAFWCRP